MTSHGGGDTPTQRGTESVAPAESAAPPTPSAPRQAANRTQARAELAEQLIEQGVEQKRAERVAEATIRRAEARAGHSVFYYADVEQQFEQRCRSVGADPRRIEASKRRVWTAARATAEEHGVAFEEALFFCYHEGLERHREFLFAVAPGEETPEGRPVP